MSTKTISTTAGIAKLISKATVLLFFPVVTMAVSAATPEVFPQPTEKASTRPWQFLFRLQLSADRVDPKMTAASFDKTGWGSASDLAISGTPFTERLTPYVDWIVAQRDYPASSFNEGSDAMRGQQRVRVRLNSNAFKVRYELRF